MASYAFCRGKYNEEVLNYLGRYFNGTTKELLSIWKAAKDFDYENKELEERIIVQMLFTGAYVGSIDGIYDSYFKKGASGKIRKAYMFSKSYDYFVRENIVEDSVFKYIERDIYNGEDINDVCKLAFLKHMSVQDEISGEMAETCRKLIYKLAKVNKVFEFYKAFNKYFSLPYYIFDKTVAEYRTNPESRVYIHYIIEDGYSKDNEYKIAQMTDMCNGVFTYQFVLFYGESVQYYITEENDSEVLVTESSSIKMTDVEFANDSTQYGMLNDILVCREMREERTFEKMAKDYIIKKELMNTVFEIKR